MANDMGQSFGWDGEIDAVENEFELMEPGEYWATVENVERQQFNGSDKMCACPIAKVNVRLDNGRVLSDRLFLNSKSAWKITQFFVSIGMRAVDAPKEQKLKMDWVGAVGRRCKIKVGTHEYKDKTYNEISEWMKPEAQAAAPQRHVYGNANPEPVSPALQGMINSTFQQAQAAQNGGF